MHIAILLTNKTATKVDKHWLWSITARNDRLIHANPKIDNSRCSICPRNDSGAWTTLDLLTARVRVCLLQGRLQGFRPRSELLVRPCSARSTISYLHARCPHLGSTCHNKAINIVLSSFTVHSEASRTVYDAI